MLEADLHQSLHLTLLLHEQFAHPFETFCYFCHLSDVICIFFLLILGSDVLVGEVDLKWCVCAGEDESELLVLDVVGVFEDP